MQNHVCAPTFCRSKRGSCEWRMYWLTMSTLERYSRADGSVASVKKAVTVATKIAYLCVRWGGADEERRTL